MSETGEKKVALAHDREVRVIALAHAVNLAERQRVPGCEGGRYDAEAIVAMAETFRAYLTVPGGHSYSLYQDGETVRASLPPSGTVVLPLIGPSQAGPPVARDLVAEFRELVQFAQWLAAQEAAGKATG